MTLQEHIKELIDSNEVINEDGQVCHSSLQVFTKSQSNRIHHIMRDMGYVPVFAGRAEVVAWAGKEVYYLIHLGNSKPIPCHKKDLHACKMEATGYARYGCGGIEIRTLQGDLVASREYFQNSTHGFGWGVWVNEELAND